MTQPNPRFRFDKEKAIEVIIFLTKALGEAHYRKVLKLMYFADKTHLEQLGRTIDDDSYIALQSGVYPENALKLIKDSILDVNNPSFHMEYNHIIADRECNEDELSESDIQILNNMVKVYAGFPLWQLSQFSQDDAWRNAWQNKWRHQPSPGAYQVNFLDIIESVDDLDGSLMKHLMGDSEDGDIEKIVDHLRKLK